MSLRRFLIALCVLFAPPMVITSGPRIVELEHEEVAVALDARAFVRRLAVDQPPPPAPPSRRLARHRRRRAAPDRHLRGTGRRPARPGRRAARRTLCDAGDDEAGGDDDDDKQG